MKNLSLCFIGVTSVLPIPCLFGAELAAQSIEHVVLPNFGADLNTDRDLRNSSDDGHHLGDFLSDYFHQGSRAEVTPFRSSKALNGNTTHKFSQSIFGLRVINGDLHLEVTPDGQ